MIGRGFLAACALAQSLSASTETNVAPWHNPAVVRVDCTYGAGSAFRIGPRMLLSVAHVTGMAGCTIQGKPFKVIGGKGDFVEIEVTDADHNWLPIDCDGYFPGHKYEAIGYAWALDTQTVVELEGTGKKDGGVARLKGVFTVIPGMSGGPIVDTETGKVIGTTNTYDAPNGESGSVELRSTPVCANA